MMKQLAGLALALIFSAGTAHAQDAWPSRTITFIVPYAAGVYTDLVARLAARYVEAALGKTVIVDDRAGAGGIVGTQAVVNAAPDGYTFCVCSIGAISIAPFVQKVGYDPVRLANLRAGRVLQPGGPVFGTVLTRSGFERAVHEDARSLT